MACPVGPAVVRLALVGGRGGGSRVNVVRPGREQPKLGRWVLAGSGPEGGLGPLSGGEPGVFRGAVAAPCCLWGVPPYVFDVLEGLFLRFLLGFGVFLWLLLSVFWYCIATE